ncbi:phage tail tape measure protein [Haematobacter massiliensis]|uniref:phage tail tape measure protein n=1 Tax=Haematobacter massiliensis TaxID=195105 RepID=UPI0023F215C4|nr:phage tail tape measure protein [Haematobacter massiliensis]
MSNAVVGALRVMLTLNTAAFTEGLKDSQDRLKAFGSRMNAIGRDLSMKVTAPLLGVAVTALKVGGDFEAAMNRVKAATGAPAAEMTAMADAAKELGRTTQFSASEAASAIEMLAKNGLSSAQILGGALNASLQLAAASGADLAQAGDIATDVMLQFGKQAAELPGLVDGITGVLLQSKFGIDDYRLALAQAGGVAGALGVKFDDFNAAIAGTSSLFASGSDAGTSFKTFLQRLVPASAPAAAAMTALGLEFFDAAGNMKSMAEIAQELQEGLAGLSDEQKTDALSTIFGTDAMRTAVGLAQQGAEGIERLSDAIGKASAADQAAARMSGFNGAMREMLSAIEGLQIAIAEAGILQMMTQLVQAVTGIVSAMAQADPAFVRFGVVAGALAAAIGPVLVAGGALLALIGGPAIGIIAAVIAVTAAVAAFWPEIVKAKDAVVAFGSDALDWIGEKFSSLGEMVTALPARFLQVGRDIMDGLLSGLQEKWQAVKDWFFGLANGIPEWVRGPLGIHSPSRVFAEIGGYVMEGLQGGLDASAKGVEGDMRSFAQGMAQQFASVLQGATTFKDALKSTLGSLVNSFVSAGTNRLLDAVFPGHAAGTQFSPGGLKWVGERGPELMQVPVGSRVYSSARSMRMAQAEAGGGGAGVLRVELGEGLVASMLEQSGAFSVELVKASEARAERSRLARESNPHRKG